MGGAGKCRPMQAYKQLMHMHEFAHDLEESRKGLRQQGLAPASLSGFAVSKTQYLRSNSSRAFGKTLQHFAVPYLMTFFVKINREGETLVNIDASSLMIVYNSAYIVCDCIFRPPFSMQFSMFLKVK